MGSGDGSFRMRCIRLDMILATRLTRDEFPGERVAASE